MDGEIPVLHRNMRVETKAKEIRDKVRNRFLDKCHRAMEKGERTQDIFAGFVAQYCHEAGAKGPKCSDNLSFNTLPQDIQLQFVSGSCPSDLAERLDCLVTIISDGDPIEFRGNIDQLCSSTFPLMKSGLLVLDCIESRYYSVESMSAKTLTSHLCSDPSTSSEYSNTGKQKQNEDATSKREKGSGDRDDKGNSNTAKDKGGKGSIQSEVPTKAPVQVVSPTGTWQSAHPMHVKRAPAARPTGYPKAIPPTTSTLDPVRNFESVKTVDETSFLPTVSPIQSRSSDNSSSTIQNLPTQNERPSYFRRSFTGSIAGASGAIFVSTALAILFVRRRFLQRKPHRRDDPALHVDVSISSERSCIYDTESFSGGSPEDESPQPKRFFSLGRWKRIDSCRKKSPPSANRFDDLKRVFSWSMTQPQAYLYATFGSKASQKTPQSDPGSFYFPPQSPYLVEERNDNMEKGKNARIFGVVSGVESMQDKNKRQLLNQECNLYPTVRRTTSIGSPRRKWQSAAQQRLSALSANRCSQNDSVPLEIHPWPSRRDRPYVALVPESDGYSDSGESFTQIPSSTGDFHRTSTDVSDEESVGSLAFLSPDIIKQFQEVDQRLSEGFKEFNEVDDRISQEFHKIESSLEKAYEVADVQNTTAEEDVDEDHSRPNRTVKAETTDGPLDTSITPTGMMERFKEEGESIRDEVGRCENASTDGDDSASVDSDKELHGFNQLRDHFANSWYRRPQNNERSDD